MKCSWPKLLRTSNGPQLDTCWIDLEVSKYNQMEIHGKLKKAATTMIINSSEIDSIFCGPSIEMEIFMVYFNT